MIEVFKARQIVFEDNSGIICPPLTYDEYIELNKEWFGPSDIAYDEYLNAFDFTEITKFNLDYLRLGFTVIPLSRNLITTCFPTVEVRSLVDNTIIGIEEHHPIRDDYFENILMYSRIYLELAKQNIVKFALDTDRKISIKYY